jgi:photosystem II stability/assembly factor-like uncharacterized protein
MSPSDDRDLKIALDALDAHQVPLTELGWDERLLSALAADSEKPGPRSAPALRRRRARLRLLLAACLALAALLVFMSSGAGAWLGLPSPVDLLDRTEPPQKHTAVVEASSKPSPSARVSHSPKASPRASSSPTATPLTRPSAISTPLVNVTPPPSWPQDPSTASAERWTRKKSGTRNDLTAVDFVGTDGWAVGMGVVLATSDDGQSWSPQSTGYDGWLFGVDFAGAEHGWVVGGAYGGVVLATSDGGTSWMRQTQVEGSLQSVSAASATSAWAAGTLGGHGRVLATSDGGATWSEEDLGGCSGLNDVCFADADHGWAVGYDGTIVATADGGKTWAAQRSRTTATLVSVTFVDASRGWAAGTAGSGTSRARAVLLSTSDGGSTWRRITLGDRGTAFGDVVFTDQLRGFAVARYLQDVVCISSEDGGRTWRTQSAIRRGRLQGIGAVSAGRACAVGARGAVYLSGSGD